MFGWDQRQRLMRDEDWTANGLAEELFAMFSPDTVASTNGPVGINPPPNVAPLQISPLQPNQPFLSISKPGGDPYGNIFFQDNQFSFVDPQGNTSIMCCEVASAPPSTFVFVQIASGAIDPLPGTVEFADDVTKGDLIVAFISYSEEQDSSGTITLTDNFGNTYIQMGTSFFSGPWNPNPSDNPPGSIRHSSSRASAFYTVANSSGPLTITVSSSDSGAPDAVVFIDALEYSGNRVDGGFSGFFQNSSILTQVPDGSDPQPFTTGPITPGLAGALTLVCVVYGGIETINAPSYTVRTGEDFIAETFSTPVAISGNITGLALGPNNEITLPPQTLPTQCCYFTMAAVFNPP